MKRIGDLDALRVISMMAVMLLHQAATGQQLADPESREWAICWVYNLLSRFSVPVFVMISGSLFLDPERDVTTRSLYLHRIPRLIGIFLVWSFTYATAESALSAPLFSEEFFLAVLRRTVTGHYHMWFLDLIMSLYLATPLLRKIAAAPRRLGTFVILCTLLGGAVRGLSLLNPENPFWNFLKRADPGLFMGYCGYYCLGSLLFRKEIPAKGKILLPLSALLAMSAAAAIGWHCINLRGILLDEGMPHVAFYATCVFYLFRENSTFFEENCKVRRILQTFAPCTLGMYLIHPAVNFLLRRAGIHGLTCDPLWWLIPCTGLVWIISFWCIAAARKLHILKKFT